jgi:hypothetical protein
MNVVGGYRRYATTGKAAEVGGRTDEAQIEMEWMNITIDCRLLGKVA